MSKKLESPFPVGAWVRDEAAKRLTGGIDRGRFAPYRGEIVSIGKVGPSLAYRIKFGGATSLCLAGQATCDVCGAPDDSSHVDGCWAVQFRDQPHEPGFAPEQAS